MNPPPTGAAPPPLPPPLPPGPARPPAKKRMHGCLIALIVAACLVIPTVGILAAIAFPAYNDYLARSRATQALAEAMPLKWQVAEFRAEHERCPGGGDADFGHGEIPLGPMQAAATFTEVGEGRCTIELSLRDTLDAIDGRRLWLQYDPGTGEWHCRSDLDARHAPVGCRD